MREMCSIGLTLQSQERFLNCIDPTTSSCILVTSRIRQVITYCVSIYLVYKVAVVHKQLLPFFEEVPLNLLSEKESVDLLLSMGKVEEVTDSALAAAKKIAKAANYLRTYQTPSRTVE